MIISDAFPFGYYATGEKSIPEDHMPCLAVVVAGLAIAAGSVGHRCRAKIPQACDFASI